MANLLIGTGGVIDTTVDLLKRLRSPIQTQRAISTILGLCAFGILVIGVVAFSLGSPAGFSFFAWSVLAAMASTFSGGVLGLLFGLPSTRKVETRATSASGETERVVSGYEESTSLEQIADWLTKIIVGLTLTQWATWSAAFNRLALTLTHDLLCPAQVGPCGYAPGGALVSGYFLGGFVVAYMWIRRFFIIEM
jgi:hypothetical protein